MLKSVIFRNFNFVPILIYRIYLYVLTLCIHYVLFVIT